MTMAGDTNSVDGDDDFVSSTASQEEDDKIANMSIFTGSVDRTGDGDDDDKEEQATTQSEDEMLAKEEKETVDRMRSVVLTVMCVSIIGTTLAIFFYARGTEDSNFQEIFINESQHVFDAIGAAISTKLLLINAFLTNVEAFDTSVNGSWPFVTSPDFPERASQTLLLADSIKLSQYHQVGSDQQGAWGSYAVQNDGWVEEAKEFQTENLPWKDMALEGNAASDGAAGGNMFLPLWQNFPVSEAPEYNLDGISQPIVNASIPFLLNGTNVLTGSLDFYGNTNEGTSNQPAIELHAPILTGDQNAFEGLISLRFFWKDIFDGILPTKSGAMTIVVSNTCQETFSFQKKGDSVSFLGAGDRHDDKYSDFEEEFDLSTISDLNLEGDCLYRFSFYPTESKYDTYSTSNPWILALACLIVFVFTASFFTLYDYVVEFKNQAVMQKAARSNAIIKSLFPSNVRERVLEADHDFALPKARLSTFLQTGETSTRETRKSATYNRPIADLFPNTTVMFSDIAGFTAWSSVREPTHVFQLLEALYGEFDAIAKRRGVFKVETIGDAYVAVAGLPEPRDDHAIVMVKMARECRAKCIEVTKKLETTLGPGTGELRYRFGLHSGPVVAGVLRGEKSRFQLFGDTVNTASRMESTGFANRIQISESTATLLLSAGKSHWITPREERIEAKGKGELQTYWIETQNNPNNDTKSQSTEYNASSIAFSVNDERRERLITWNTDILKRSLRQIIAARMSAPMSQQDTGDTSISSGTLGNESDTILDEVVEIVELPDFDIVGAAKHYVDPDDVEVDDEVYEELRNFVAAISKSYRDNPFHSFDHASHVLMSTSKLLNRIVAPDVSFPERSNDMTMTASSAWMQEIFHDHTYGITSDPLTQFACVFAALIHDVDHRGVPNNQLVKEEAALAEQFGEKSTAEQHSVNMAWSMLTSDKYVNLMHTICPTKNELRRFRQLVVNCVMATDIVDPDLKKLRNSRWERAFSTYHQQESDRDRINRKATIVIEHLIQASDVAHTMQHWHVYIKWNGKLFEELYEAYVDGRASKNPAEFWYAGELWFFDNYIIPLARKLSECGVFGVSSDEYLNYALKNRDEWERRGEAILESYIERMNRKQELEKKFSDDS